MPIITSSLTIGGTAVNRGAQRVTLQRVSFGIAGDESLDICQEVAGSLAGSYHPGQTISLALTDGTTTRTVFVGRITGQTVAGIGSGVISVGYHARGMRWLANQIFTTSASDGTGRLVYNLPNTDKNWSRNLSGLSVGTILGDYFAMHSAQLTALGVSQPPAGDLAALTVVPNDPVVMTGRIFDMADALMAQWGCGKYQLFIDPDTLQIRILDATTLPAATLTLGSDPIQLSPFTIDVANAYTQVILRGGGLFSAMVCSLSSGTLADGWTSSMESTWTINAFLYPSNSVLGTITSMTTTSVTADAFTGPVTSWGTNYWNGAQIWVQYGFGSNFGGTTATVQYSETAEVTATTATSGGSATFTVDVPFSSTVYTTVEIRGAPTGEALVYRKYTIPDSVKTPSGLQLNLHLAQTMPGSVPWNPVDGVVTQATGPQAEVYYSAGCTGAQQAMSMTFQVYPSPDGTTAGYIVFDSPTCMPFSSQASLKVGAPDGKACDVKVLLPYADGALSSHAPASGFSGTAYTMFGWQQTLYRDYPNWLLKGQNTNMGTLAGLILQSVQQATIDGAVVYHGIPLALMALGQSLNVTGGLATGSFLASMACPIRAITIEWPDYGGSYQVTQLHLNNQRKPYTGDNLFLHPLAARGKAEGDWSLEVPAPRMAGRGDESAERAEVAEVPGLAGSEDAPRSPYRKPSERKADRKRSSLAKAAAEGKRKVAEASRKQRRKEGLKAKHAGRVDRDRARDYDSVSGAYGYTPAGTPDGAEAYRADMDKQAIAADQKENDRRVQARRDRKRTSARSMRMRGSDSGIVNAHQSAYGAHDPAGDIGDAHRSAYGPGGAADE